MAALVADSVSSHRWSLCRNELKGQLLFDGTQLELVGCRSGQAFGFSGLELTDAHGHRLRLAAHVDGTATPAVFQPGSTTGDELGRCGMLTMRRQSSTISGIGNIEGTATLTCDGRGHKLAGTVQFRNCH